MSEILLQQLLKSLDEIQAIEIVVIDVKAQTSVTDYMIVCTGRSSRHVKAIAELVIEQMKSIGLKPFSQTGIEAGEWALVDFGDYVLHIMQSDARLFYNLEALWQTDTNTKK